MAEAVHIAVGAHLDKKKFVTLIGGDHSVSIGSVRAYVERFEKLTVLQLDAHANLRDRHMGSTCSRSCAMYEASKRTNLVQVGIRSMDISEKAHMKRENVFFAHEIKKNPEWMNEALERMTRDVYLSIDLSVFDPSMVPSTTGPEPGGMFWDETLKFIRKVNKRRNIVGFDIVELAPNPNDKSSDFLMARLHYKLLSYIFKKKNKKND
jgi:agmatinase